MAASRIWCPGPVSRRGLIKGTIAASLGYVLGRNFIPTAWAADEDKNAKSPAGYGAARGKARNIILLWMSGGPSHLDTFDPKPGTKESGGVKGIEAATGLQISEKLPKLAKQGRHLCVLRGVSSKEGDHGQASHLMHTGYREQSGVEFPSLGSIVCAEARDGPQTELPSYVAINGGGFGSGFLGAQYAPFVTGAGQAIPDLKAPTAAKKVDERRKLLEILDKSYSQQTSAPLAVEHWQTYERAVKLSRSPLANLFEIKGEDQKHAQAYGKSDFGRACFIAKNLVSKGGVRFVEIDQGGWDTHNGNDEATKNLCNQIDQPFAQLLEDLATDGLLQSTLVIWMGEFGRTPTINGQGGRDHYPRCFSMALAGGGVKGGQAIGKSNASGHEPDGNAITVPNIFYSVCEAAGIDATKVRDSADGRPIQIVDRGAKPVPGIFG
jgi:hypothetical protein